MKFLTTIHNINNLNHLLEADGYIVGNQMFSVRITTSFEPSEINQIIDFGKDNQKEIFLSLNMMFRDHDFDLLEAFLSEVNVHSLQGIIVSDLGLVQYLVDHDLASKIVWQGETLSTNQYDFNFLNVFNVYGSFTAKEITIDDILLISKHKDYQLFLTGHGHLNMFYSKRHLISNFKDQYQLAIDPTKPTYHLVENRRDNETYPIIEDSNGTHVFRSSVTHSFNQFSKLKEAIDYFVIDSIFKDDLYSEQVLSLYRHGYDEEKVLELKNNYHETWDEGFYLQKTVYLKENI